MSVLVRGVKNAFRNRVRTGAVVFILAIGIGLSLAMLVANKAVEQRIADLKTQMGTALTISPAGARGFEGGGEPLTTDDLDTVRAVPHISRVDASLQLRLRNQDAAGNFMMRGPGGQVQIGNTNLMSPIDPGTLGRRFGQQNSANPEAQLPENFSLPITATGISGTKDAAGKDINITSGRNLTDDDAGAYIALVGTALAAKNNLSAGSTFTAYNQTITVAGIFDQGTEFENAGLYLPLKTAQALSGQTGEVGTMVAQVDSIDNLESAKAAVQSALGDDTADVASSQQDVDTAISSLQSVQKISIAGFVAALVAAGVIIFMIMLVVVRERRREIGVLKAIGASNLTIVKQFMVEAMVLVLLGALAGTGVALVSSSGIANALVSSNSGSDASGQAEVPRIAGPGPVVMGPGGGGTQRLGGPFSAQTARDTSELIGDVTASVGIGTLLYGLLAAIGIGLAGSAVPAWFIAKIRPVEVMRGE